MNTSAGEVAGTAPFALSPRQPAFASELPSKNGANTKSRTAAALTAVGYSRRENETPEGLEAQTYYQCRGIGGSDRKELLIRKYSGQLSMSIRPQIYP
jgi:hypothetical protein